MNFFLFFTALYTGQDSNKKSTKRKVVGLIKGIWTLTKVPEDPKKIAAKKHKKPKNYYPDDFGSSSDTFAKTEELEQKSDDEITTNESQQLHNPFNTDNFDFQFDRKTKRVFAQRLSNADEDDVVSFE